MKIISIVVVFILSVGGDLALIFITTSMGSRSDAFHVEIYMLYLLFRIVTSIFIGLSFEKLLRCE